MDIDGDRSFTTRTFTPLGYSRSLIRHVNTLFRLCFLSFSFSSFIYGASCSSMVEQSLLVCGSYDRSFMVDQMSYFSFQPVLHDWCNKDRSMCYPVCGMMHIKLLLLLIGKSSPCGGSGFPFSLSEWSFTVWRLITVNKMFLVRR